MTEPVLVVRRRIAATPERLFAAWTSPDQLRAWWGPRGVRCVDAVVELRVGGHYRIDNQLPDGTIVVIRGVFERIEPPSRLVYSWQVGDEPTSRVTVEFVAVASATDVIVVHERVSSAAVREDHERGWNGCLDGLAEWALRVT